MMTDENISSGILLAVGAVSYNVPFLVAHMDVYMTFLFHLLSAVSVFMICVINKKKFIEEIKTWFKKGNQDGE